MPCWSRHAKVFFYFFVSGLGMGEEKYSPGLAYTWGLNRSVPGRALRSACSAQGGCVLHISGDNLLVLDPSDKPAQRPGSCQSLPHSTQWCLVAGNVKMLQVGGGALACEQNQQRICA